MTREQKIQYLKEHNLARFVSELAIGDPEAVDGAIEWVYDQHTLTTEEFRKKYFGQI